MNRANKESPKKAAMLSKFRESVSDILKPEHDDNYLARWLRARNYNISEAEKMLRNHFVWREQFGADTIVNDWTPPEVLLKYHPGGFFGHDKEGCPIWIDPIGRADVKGLLASAKKSDLLRFKIRHCEQINQILFDLEKKLNKPIGLVIIFDVEFFGMKHLWKPALDAYTELLSLYEANYPETLKKTYVINAPAIFSFAYSLVKPFLCEDTKRKIHIIRGNWKKQLLQDIDADQLPVHYGGTCVDEDGDEFCRSKLPIGGQVDPSYYIPDYSCVDRDTFTRVTISARASLVLSYPIDQIGSVIRWQFLTEGRDIAFGILWKPSSESDSDSKDETILPIGRLNSHMVPEDGSINCAKLGTYILKFDNSYSWATKKKLLYQIDVMPPFSEAMTPADEAISPSPFHDSDSFQASGDSSVYSLVPENCEDEIR